MTTLSTVLKTSNKPVERKVALGQNITEQAEGKDRIGFFDENLKGFDATQGSLTFSQIPEIFQKAFEGESLSKLDPSKNVPSEIFVPGIFTTFETTQKVVQKGISAMGGVLGDSGDAIWDLAKTVTGKTEVPQDFQKAFENEDPSKLDPSKKPQEAKPDDLKNYSIIKEAEKVIAKAQADYRGEKLFDEAVKSKRAEIAGLANLQDSYKGVLDNQGEIRTDLQAVVAQKEKEIVQAQQAKQEPLVSASKQDGQGRLEEKYINKANETSGGNTNATNAVA